MVLSDNPILEDKEDKLRRAPLALKVSELIKNFKGGESFVIGIEGAWGAGKSSFVNLVINDLGKSEDVIILTFNPWNFTGQNELLAEFFSSLSSVLAGKLDKEGVDTLRSYASKLQVSVNPKVTLFGVLDVDFSGSIKGGKDTLQGGRKKIDDRLKELGKRIVIIIDDIDRLDKEETRLIMKLVKMTANFPNTIFLLAYDRDRVCERLNEDGWPGEEYLKKIIQVSFTLPQPDQQQLLQILFQDLDETILGVYGDVKLEDENEKRWGEMLYKGFRDLFKTVRDIKRFVSSLRLNWSIIGKDEVNLVDFMGIEVIRVFAPSFYSAVAANKALFTDTSSHEIGSYSGNEKVTKDTQYKELLALVPEAYRAQIEGISQVLFPQVDPQMNYGHEWQSSWRKEKRICAEERFDFYFQLGIPSGAISETEVAGLVQSLENQEQFSKSILKLKEGGKLRKTFVKLMDHLDTFSEAQIRVLVGSLWDLEKQIDEERTEVFDFDDVETWIGRLAYHGLMKVTQSDRLQFTKELLENSKTLYHPLRFVALEEDGIGKERNRDQLFAKEEIEELKPIVVKRINEYASDARILQEKSFVRILYIWKRWEGEEKVASYIESLISTREGLLSFMRSFVSTVISTGGNYKRISRKTLAGLYPTEKIETLINAITEEELSKMDEDGREAISLFKNPSKDHLDD